MDQSLNAHVKLDTASDVVRIDVRGSLTQASRPSLLQTIQRVRHTGINSHIRVHLGHAQFVESSALAGLRSDLNAIDGVAQLDVAGELPGSSGVSLELNPTTDDPNSVLRSLDLDGDATAATDSSGTGPLTVLSDDELLAASDTVFGMLDNPADMASSELLATYDEIGLEISRREDGLQPEPA
jgi:anti-anti-sigma regulatory factor